jgi:hypothetical protein
MAGSVLCWALHVAANPCAAGPSGSGRAAKQACQVSMSKQEPLPGFHPCPVARGAHVPNNRRLAQAISVNVSWGFLEEHRGRDELGEDIVPVNSKRSA